MLLIESFDRGVALNPDGVCLMTANGSMEWTYSEAAHVTHRIASALQDAGAGDGAKVGVLSPNDPNAFLCILGALRAGSTWVPLNALSAAPDLADLLTLTGCDALFYHGDLTDKATEILEAIPSPKTVVRIGQGREEDPDLWSWMAPSGSRVDLPMLHTDRAAILVGTGGTTGRSKAVELSHHAIQLMNYALAVHMPEERPIHLVAAPMTHAAGVIGFVVLALGGTVVFLDRFRPREVLEAIEARRITRLFLPPTAIYSLLAQPGVRSYDYSSLRYFIYSAAPMSVEKLREALEVFGPVMAQTYGQAEAPQILTYFGPAEHLMALQDPRLNRRLASCGTPSLMAHVEIMSDEGEIVGPETIGEIVVRTDMRMTRYYADPEQTASVDRGHGWQGTGDVGLKDQDGFVYIVDRKKDMIISGGFNVFPSEVERVLQSHVSVLDCAVIGIPDDKWGEAVTAVVELKPAVEVSGEELIQLCKQQLGSVKAPKSVVFRDLPRSPVGKVLRRQLRDEYWQGRPRKI